MILVTVGNHVQAFDRLIRAVDELAADLDEEIVMQIGHGRYRPQHATYFDFTTGEHLQKLTEQARVQVSHAGSGSILTAFRLGTPLVVVPRLCRYDEHIDDHQLQLARALEAEGRLVALYEVSAGSLRQAIDRAVEMVPAGPRESGGARLVDTLRAYLDGLSAAPAR